MLPLESLHYIQQGHPGVLEDQAFVFPPDRIALGADEQTNMQHLLLWSATQLDLTRVAADAVVPA